MKKRANAKYIPATSQISYTQPAPKPWSEKRLNGVVATAAAGATAGALMGAGNGIGTLLGGIFGAAVGMASPRYKDKG